ncbi:MAG: hypothetical protein IJ555_09945, partial [Ruminococcus sp.]|nr:hypothetical protein [Ruminococcus sp.]
PHPYNDECAINDTGFVTTDKGTYIFAVFTDYPYAEYTDYTPPNPLLGLTEAIYNFHLSMTTPVLPEEAAVSVDK